MENDEGCGDDWYGCVRRVGVECGIRTREDVEIVDVGVGDLDRGGLWKCLSVCVCYGEEFG